MPSINGRASRIVIDDTNWSNLATADIKQDNLQTWFENTFEQDFDSWKCVYGSVIEDKIKPGEQLVFDWGENEPTRNI